MRKTIIKIVAVLTVALSVLPALPARAVLILTCADYSKTQVIGDAFQNYQKVEYINGLLVMHFAFNPEIDFHSVSTGLRIMDSNCREIMPPVVQRFFILPTEVRNFSFHFLTDRSYQIYDDDTNLPVDCEQCNASFQLPTSAPPGPYKANFLVGWGDFQTNINSTAEYINQTSIAPSRPPVLIVPGILGTELYRNQELLWPNVFKMLNPLGSDDFMDPLAFDRNLNPVDNSVVTGSVIKSVDPFLVNIPKIDYTEGLTNELQAQGYKENQDLFTLAFDWRLSVEQNAQTLKGMVLQIMKQTQSDKVDVIAHSTGGLVTEKYILDNPDHHLGKVIFVGTPQLGAPKATKALLMGDGLDVLGLSSTEIKKIAQNMPVIYDLSPSAAYVAKTGDYIDVIKRQGLFSFNRASLDYNQTKDYLLSNKGLNPLGIAESEQLHSSEFDNFDPARHGVDAYSIVGCKNSTIGTITDGPLGYTIDSVQGDGTVPFPSANNIPVNAQNKFFAVNVKHADLLSANGPRQLIAKILTGNNSLATGVKITADSSQCKLNGKRISIFSPVNIEVTDSAGYRLGFLPDGSQQNDIEGASFDTAGDHKFVFLPTDNDQHYTVNLSGTDNGTFTLKVQDIVDDRPETINAYYDIPVHTGDQGQLNLNSSSQLSFDSVNYNPVSVSPLEATDLVPPELTVRFDLNSQKPIFGTTDNLTEPVAVTETANKVVATDRAGNVTELQYALTQSGQQAVITLTKLTYNGVATDLFSNQLRYNNVVQQFRNDETTNITVVNNDKKTVVAGQDNQQLVNEKFNNRQVLQIVTKQGQLQWDLIPF